MPVPVPRGDIEGAAAYAYNWPGAVDDLQHELEILDSDREPEEVRTFLYNIVHYILEYDVVFRDGQTCGMLESERIKISLSPGRLVHTESFKLAY